MESWEEERGPEDEDEDEGMPRRVERAWRWVWRTGWRSERERVLLAASGGGVWMTREPCCGMRMEREEPGHREGCQLSQSSPPSLGDYPHTSRSALERERAPRCPRDKNHELERRLVNHAVRTEAPGLRIDERLGVVRADKPAAAGVVLDGRDEEWSVVLN